MATPAPSYRAALAVPGFGRIAGATLIGRTAEAMLSVVMVLFVLQRFHSPGLAGLTVLASLGPSLALSPVAGALLDRYGRVRLIMFDYLVGGGALAAIAVLSTTGRLTPGLLIVLSVFGGITGMLSAAGMRSVVPLLLPPELWGRGNAIDSSGYTLTVIVGPALGGLLVGLLGPEGGLGVGAALYVVGAASLFGLAEPGTPHIAVESILRSSLEGLRYVLRNRVLRGIAISLTLVNIGAGIAVVAMPVLALQTFHASSATVGLLWACQGVGGVIAGFAFGRIDTSRRAWRLIIATYLLVAVGTAVIAGAPSLVLVGVGILLAGLATGPMDVTLFSLRQRVTGPKWYGRAIAISMSLNFAGFPVGSGLSGVFVRVGPRFALATAAVLTVGGALVAAAVIPRRPDDQAAVP